MILRPYQQQVVDDYRRGQSAGHICQILALATGAGKTACAVEEIRARAGENKRSLFIVDKIELVNQAVRHLQQFDLDIGVLQADNTFMHPSNDVVVASIQTIRARRAPVADFIVVDEVHVLHKSHVQLMEAWNNVAVMGLSATPLAVGLGKHFSNLIRGPSIRQLVADGYLVQANAYCPRHEEMNRILGAVKTCAGDYIDGQLSTAMNRKELVGDIVSTWQEKASDRLTLCFAVDIAHSKSIVEDFVNAGVKAAHVDAYTPESERAEIVAAFKNGHVRILSSVNIMGTGVDIPEASCGILARPTLSEIVHMQQQGRLIRTAPGKDDALLLDHAGNTLKFGLPVHFEVPDLDDGDQLSTKDKRKQKKLVACAACGYALEPAQITCPACGVDRVTRRSQITYIDGQLVAYASANDNGGSMELSPWDKKQWYLAFLWYAKHRGWKNGWAFHAYLEKFDEKPVYNWQFLEPQVPTDAQARWCKYYTIRQAKAWAKRRAG